MLPDLKNRVLVDGKTLISSRGSVQDITVLGITTILKDETVHQKLLEEFPELYNVSKSVYLKPNHVFHHIETF